MEVFIGILIFGVIYYVFYNLVQTRNHAYNPPPPPLEVADRLPCGLEGWWLLHELFVEGRISVALFLNLADHRLEEIQQILIDRELLDAEELSDYLEEARLRSRTALHEEGDIHDAE